MPFFAHNKYHRRILKHLHEYGPEFSSRLILKASGVPPARINMRRRGHRANQALEELRKCGLIKVLDKGRNKQKDVLTFEGWVYYATIALEEPDGQETNERSDVDRTEQPPDNGGSVSS